jgi:hypothetical protein
MSANITRDFIEVQKLSAEQFDMKVPTAIEMLELHGREFNDLLNVKQDRMGLMGMCYMNASRMMFNHASLVYVEGMAYSSFFPMWHGWCWNPRLDKALDPTWKDGKDYIGIPFKQEFVCKFQLATGEFGILDCLWKVAGKAPKLIDEILDGTAVYGK